MGVLPWLGGTCKPARGRQRDVAFPSLALAGLAPKEATAEGRTSGPWDRGGWTLPKLLGTSALQGVGVEWELRDKNKAEWEGREGERETERVRAAWWQEGQGRKV